MKYVWIAVRSFVVTIMVLVVVGVARGNLPTPPAIPPSQEQEAPRQKYHLKPEARIEISRLDRIELFVGGLHVGTILFDGAGHAIFLGDATQVKGVLGELLTFLQWLRDAARGAELSGSRQES